MSTPAGQSLYWQIFAGPYFLYVGADLREDSAGVEIVEQVKTLLIVKKRSFTQ